MRVPLPRLYLGTMTFGWESQTSSIVNEQVALDMVKLFVTDQNRGPSSGGYLIDTARVYSGGDTEPIVGSTLRQFRSSSEATFLVGTKAHPSQPMGLSEKGIRSQLKASVTAMGEDTDIGEYYLHQPDVNNSLLTSLKCAHDLVTEGLVSSIGMSNYHASEMERAFGLCEEHGLTKPSVYQGLYNPLNRLVEAELIPLLHRNNCSFVAYNPLAAGLLTGKHSFGKSDVLRGRFKNNPNYLPRFYTEPNFRALDLIREACMLEGISMIDATFRWMLLHSALKEVDGVLLGASSTAQLEQNLNACKAAETAELPMSILSAFDEAWKMTEEGAFPYWRSYSSDMPGRETLDQGASYSATKKA